MEWPWASPWVSMAVGGDVRNKLLMPLDLHPGAIVVSC